MIDTTKLEHTTEHERISELEHEVAELRRTVEHPALMKLISDHENRAAAQRMLTDEATRRQASIIRPTWTPDSGTPPPATITRQELLLDDAWNDQIDAKWASGWTYRDALARSEDGSPVLELARRALLAHWRLRHIEMEMTRARSAGDAVAAEMYLAYKTAKTEHEHVGAELGTMLPEVANALALVEQWDRMEHQERVLYGNYYRQADVIIASKAMAPLPEMPEIRHKKGWFR